MTLTPNQSMTPAEQFASWGSLVDQLDALVCGDQTLQPADDTGYDEAMPALCWAVPGAYGAAAH